MSFDRKRNPELKTIARDVLPGADADEIQLPDELAALAEQLRDDAEHLAAEFPPDWSRQRRSLVRRDRPERAGRFAVAVISLATLAALLLIAVGGWVQWQTTRLPVADGSAPVQQPAVHVRRTEDRFTQAASRQRKTSGEAIFRNQPSPVLFLQDITGPELEGVLDLLEKDTTGSESFSI